MPGSNVTLWSPYTSRAGSAPFAWDAQTNPPGAGRVSTNNATLASVTQLRFDDEYGMGSAKDFLSSIAAGTKVRLLIDSTHWVEFNATTAAVAQAGGVWYLVTVTYGSTAPAGFAPTAGAPISVRKR